MTRRHLTGTVALLAALGLAGATGCSAAGAPSAHPSAPAASPAAAKGRLTVSAPYMPRPVDASMAAAYFVVRNAGGTADRLERVTAPGFAEKVEAHTTKNNRMMMVRGYDVPAGGTLTLARDGNHLMLMKLSHRPKVGDTVRLRLYFAKAGRVDLAVPVEAATYRPPGDGGAGHDMTGTPGMTGMGVRP